MKATEQNFPVVLFVMLCKVVLISDSSTEIIKGDNSRKGCQVIFFSGAILIQFAVQGSFWSLWMAS